MPVSLKTSIMYDTSSFSRSIYDDIVKLRDKVKYLGTYLLVIYLDLPTRNRYFFGEKILLQANPASASLLKSWHHLRLHKWLANMYNESDSSLET